MQSEIDNAIALSKANESLRQEAAAFDQSLIQYRQWMRVRRAMLWTGVALLPAVMVVCTLILTYHERFTATTVSAASAALLVDSLGIVGAVWKGTIGLAAPTVPVPITQMPNGSVRSATYQVPGQLSPSDEAAIDDEIANDQEEAQSWRTDEPREPREDGRVTSG
jgi:hypothetical protein